MQRVSNERDVLEGRDVLGGKVVEVFFDGACPLCRREVGLLRKLDRRQRIVYTDIASAAFNPNSYGLTQAKLMDRIHGRLPSGEVIEGVEVFRQLYSAVGLGLLMKPTRWPVIAPALDLAYRVFAKNRLRLTGRCHEGVCGVPHATH